MSSKEDWFDVIWPVVVARRRERLRREVTNVTEG